MKRPEGFDDATIYLLQKLLPGRDGRTVDVIEGYTRDWEWAEKWRNAASPYHPRSVIPIRRFPGAP